ncbi:MAG: putative toxin-antitoxin system toxin component, PIN family [Deltaproteobacteria bacterium]|nr:putative toxin-antitoxin system toxin component, PIN family [Deltaproteobacteria bacterium]
MRAVADTNVYISALNFGGTAEEVLALGRANILQLFISPSILQEIEGVLLRKFHWSATRTRQALAVIQGFAQLVRPKEAIHFIAEDEPDNRILECALEADADLIITGDHHLRGLKTFRGIPILSPGEFLETHRRGTHE